MISLLSITKKFKNKTAVDNLNFKTKTGEIIGFVGPNGAGKTTTMRLILGYLKPSSGTVFVFGKNPIEKRDEILPKVGYLPENNPLYLEMKVSEYLAFITSLKHEKNIGTIIQLIGLDEVLETKIENLSRGFKQRVGLAAALCGNPELLILDEPTSGLDPIEQDKIKDLIKKMSKGKTIIFSTHVLFEVEDVATRLMIINKGSMVYDGVKPKGKGSVEKLFKKLIRN